MTRRRPLLVAQLAKIFTTSEASIDLFEAEGYRRVGVHERDGTLDGVCKDVVVVERTLDAR